VKSFLIFSVVTSSILFGQLKSPATISVKPPTQDGAPASATAVKSTDWGSFAVLGEAGYKNLRGSVTYGARFSKNTRFKVSGEYLTQKLHYDFKAHDHDEWSKQYAIGTEFQGILSHSTVQSIDVAAAYVHAFGHTLSASVEDAGVGKRNIAGSDGALTSAGATFNLWNCGYLSVAADYDYVKFQRKLASSRTVNGFGGSASFVQGFAKDYTLTLETEIRQPFYYYGGMLNWNHQFKSCAINLGSYLSYTNGRAGAPNIATGGIQFGLSFGNTRKECPRTDMIDDACYTRSYCDLSQWVAIPAVRVPIVLAQADPCTTPTFTVDVGGFGVPVGFSITATITNTSPPSAGPVTFTTSSSNNAVVSVTQPVGGTFTITGVSPGFVTITVTATTKCGSSTITIPGNVPVPPD
jgi:hypothetical protein